MDIGASDLGMSARPSGGFARHNLAPDCKLHHGRLGFLPGSDLVHHPACLDLAAGRTVLRRTREQLLGLVSHRLRVLPVVRAVSAPRLNKPGSAAVFTIGNWQFSSTECPQPETS